jgi:septum formation protein
LDPTSYTAECEEVFKVYLILASGSPRRRLLLEGLGLKFEVVPPSNDENMELWDDPHRLVENLAQQKAREVSSKVKTSVVLAADTIVVKDGEVMGKPHDRLEAIKMLQQLSGGKHQVITGVCLIDMASNKELVDSETTTVHFRTLSEPEITRYVDSGEPFDKAGGYGIQEKGALLVSGIEGCFYNVVGLPLAKLQTMFQRLGISLL